jgi:hypothetical protein
MIRGIRTVRGLILAGAGLAAGLLLAAFWPNTPLHAVATDRSETFAIATGHLDEQVEAIYFLDGLTGDLRGMALSRQFGTFNAFFGPCNVAMDLGVDPSKNPKFLMTTGMADLRRTGGGASATWGRGIVYVAEITTGKVAAYGTPWSPTAFAANRPFKMPLKLLDVKPFRTPAAPVAATKP